MLLVSDIDFNYFLIYRLGQSKMETCNNPEMQLSVWGFVILGGAVTTVSPEEGKKKLNGATLVSW